MPNMHPEIKAALNKANQKYPAPDAVTLQSAEKLLHYIDDINLERTGKFTPTPSQSLFVVWNVEDWEFHMECTRNGSVLYTFSQAGIEKASGSYPVDEFIPQLERYLLLGVA
jgi:glutathionylspermidine synthase